ncbi:MAG TPA: GerMN domain-containing protein [Acidimicrobiales bacterium]|nr:GerMN domain-containing protein [Acidimicrobiales bacterium]
MKIFVSRWPVVTAALALLALSSCGSDRPSDAGPAPSRVPSTDTSVPTTEPEEASRPAGSSQPVEKRTTSVATTTVAIYLVKGELLEKVTRRVPKVPAIGGQAMEALLAGPTPAESAAGVTTAIPDGTRLLGLVIEEATATVDLSPAYESGGGTLGLTLRLAQVACTLDQFGTVDGVRFALAGRRVRVFSGNGIVLEEPVSCDDYRDHLPGQPPPPPPPPCTPGELEPCGPEPDDPSTLGVHPRAGEPGQELVATVSGFAPEVSVVVELVRVDPYGPVLGFQVRTDRAGYARERFLVPGDAPPGAYQLVATSEDGSDTASSPLTVLASSNCPAEQQPTC